MIKLKLGFPVWYGDKDIVKAIRDVGEAGFNYVELSFEYPFIYKYPLDLLRKVKDVGESYNLKFGIHAPWRDIAISNPIEYIRSASLRVCIEALERSLILEPIYFNVHLSTFEESSEFWDDILEATIKSLNELKSVTDNYGIPLTVENVIGSLATPDEFSKVLERVDGVYVCLDIGHAVMSHVKRGGNANEYLDVINTWVNSVPSNRLLVVHLHDFKQVCNVKLVDHIMLGSGMCDLVKVIKVLRKFKDSIRYVNLEVFKWSEFGGNVKPVDIKDYIVKVKRAFEA